MFNVVNQVSLGAGSSIVDLQDVDIKALDNVGIKDGQANIFENILHAGIDPISKASENMQDKISSINNAQQETGGVVEPSKLIGLQNEMSHLVVGVTVATKILNSGIKAVNELTHIQ